MSDLKVTASELSSLITDLDTMQSTLQKRIDSMNNVVDRIETGWKGSAAGAYNHLQRDVNETARRLRERLVIIEEAMKMSRDGFDREEMDQMQEFKKLQQMEGGQSKILDMA